MAKHKLKVKRMKIGDYTVPDFGPVSFTEDGINIHVVIKDTTIELDIAIGDVNKCLAHLGSIKKTAPNTYQRHPQTTCNDDIMCLELSPPCSKRVLAGLNAAKPGCKIQLIPDGSRIATKYIIMAVETLQRDVASFFQSIFPPPDEPDQPTKFRELSSTGLNLILQDFNKDTYIDKTGQNRSKPATYYAGESDSDKTSTTKVKVIPGPKAAINKSPDKDKMERRERPIRKVTDESSSDSSFYARVNIKETNKIFNILGNKYGKVEIKRMPHADFLEYSRKRLRIDKATHGVTKRANLGSRDNEKEVDRNKSKEADKEKRTEVHSAVNDSRRDSSASQSERGNNSRSQTPSERPAPSPVDATPIVVLEAGAFSVGPYKGIGISSVELSSENLSLHFSTPALQQLGSAICIPSSNIVHVLAHISVEHTCVLFLYLAPPFSAVLCSYLQSHTQFSGYRKEDNFNSCGVIAVVLQPMTESKCSKFRAVCSRIGTDKGGLKAGSILHEIDAEGAGKYLKVCFSASLEDALAASDQKVTLLPPIKDESTVKNSPTDSQSSTPTSVPAQPVGENGLPHNASSMAVPQPNVSHSNFSQIDTNSPSQIQSASPNLGQSATGVNNLAPQPPVGMPLVTNAVTSQGAVTTGNITSAAINIPSNNIPAQSPQTNVMNTLGQQSLQNSFTHQIIPQPNAGVAGSNLVPYPESGFQNTPVSSSMPPNTQMQFQNPPQQFVPRIGQHAEFQHSNPQVVSSNPGVVQQPQPITIQPVVIEPELSPPAPRVTNGQTGRVPPGSNINIPRCPFSLKPIQKACKNVHCGHNYDLTSVQHALRTHGSGPLQCVVIGCSNPRPIEKGHLVANNELQRLIDVNAQRNSPVS